MEKYTTPFEYMKDVILQTMPGRRAISEPPILAADPTKFCSGMFGHAVQKCHDYCSGYFCDATRANCKAHAYKEHIHKCGNPMAKFLQQLDLSFKNSNILVLVSFVLTFVIGHGDQIGPHHGPTSTQWEYNNIKCYQTHLDHLDRAAQLNTRLNAAGINAEAHLSKKKKFMALFNTLKSSHIDEMTRKEATNLRRAMRQEEYITSAIAYEQHRDNQQPT
ncbi:hypothetical protein HDU99_004113 [Rhizoclosmatium hyalinum]|nr:hypothetical protein HDU99_004113 [Rhizoclosmatium hyalinum]